MTDVLEIHETLIVATEGRDEVLTEQVEVMEVVTAAEQGPPGPPGLPGPAGGQVLQCTAGVGISALVAVYEDSLGAVWPADPREEGDVLALLGVTVTAAQRGQPIQVQRLGHMDDSNWQWAPKGRIFLEQEGRLSQQVPLTGYDVLIGVALSPTRIFLNIQDPIELE